MAFCHKRRSLTPASADLDCFYSLDLDIPPFFPLAKRPATLRQSPHLHACTHWKKEEREDNCDYRTTIGPSSLCLALLLSSLLLSLVSFLCTSPKIRRRKALLAHKRCDERNSNAFSASSVFQHYICVALHSLAHPLKGPPPMPCLKSMSTVFILSFEFKL